MICRRHRFPALLAAALVCVAGGAAADEGGPAPEVAVPSAGSPEQVPVAALQPPTGPEPFTGAAARADWQARRHWHYGTQNLYPLTRGMDDAGIPTWAHWPLYPFTAAFDTGDLVFEAVGGLYGD